ncbi:condensation domain-containing protein, partial [Nocardia rhamnosiphila]|uniref:condensation domain-containing protein n=1 Tax=Nocardia rhamnosiphila TaxID=426716 RepID=UPI0033E1E213
MNVNIADILPLTPLQEGLFFHGVANSNEDQVYNVQFSMEFVGSLRTDRMRAACTAVLERHSNLTAGFVIKNLSQPVQVIPSSFTVPWEFCDVSGAPDPTAEVSRIEEAQRVLRFDLQRPPLIRFALARTADARHRLIVTFHHILIDGWSLPILINEFLQAYDNLDNYLEIPKASVFKNYLGWLKRRDTLASEAKWLEVFEGFSTPLIVCPTVALDKSMFPEQRSVTRDSHFTSALVERSRELGLTVSSVIYGCWALLVGFITGGNDVAFGTAMSGRSPEVDGFDKAIGLFITTVPLRVDFKNCESIVDVLVRLQDRRTWLSEHQYGVDLARIQDQIGVGTLFDTFVVYENYPSGQLAASKHVGGVDVQLVHGRDATHYPLALSASMSGSELSLRFDYRPDLFDRCSVERLVDRFIGLLQAVVANPEQRVGDIDLLTAQERERLLVE